MIKTHSKTFGAVAQLGERLDGIQKVVGSIPSSSTKLKVFYFLFFFLFYESSFANSVDPKKLFNTRRNFQK